MKTTLQTITQDTPTWTQAWALPATSRPLPDWQSLAASFTPISLAEMDGVALLNRLDTKFVMTAHQVWDALSGLQADYWMLEVDGQRLSRYHTLYFDTPAFDLYTAHVNERPERYKVRSREYASSGQAFLEVKHRTRKDRTIKQRIQTSRQLVAISREAGAWLNGVAPVDADALEPTLSNAFLRMTLVNRQCCERVTLDLALAFASDTRRIALDGIAIAEVKMDGGSAPSAFRMRMRAARVQPRGFSKYAAGVAMLYDGVKKNSLKPRLLWVEKLMKASV